jgi:fructokinase
LPISHWIDSLAKNLSLQKNILRKVFTIGETVYDIIFSDGSIQTGKPGGSMLNASVSLGRLGIDVSFISELGRDNVGDLIIEFLESNQINTQYIHRFDDGYSPLALAFLDENKNASYTFYKKYPPKRLQQQFPEISKNDIVLFGSFFSIDPEVRKPLKAFIENAKAQGALIIYDPNIRKQHQNQIPDFIEMIFENFSMADIVRASHEDFDVVFKIENAKNAFELLREHGKAKLIYTTGGDKVELMSGNIKMELPVPKINVVSTIGAGDNFNAGLIFSLVKQDIHKKDLPQLILGQWKEVLETGIRCSQEVCKSYENYIPEGLGRSLLID